MEIYYRFNYFLAKQISYEINIINVGVYQLGVIME